MTIRVDPLSATTLSQYIRLERCERYLRWSIRSDEVRRLTARFRDLGVTRPPLAPMLRAAGEYWEARIVESLPASSLDLSKGDPAMTIEAVRRLALSASCVLVQAPVAAEIGGWPCRGQADIVRATRRGDGAIDLLVADIKASREEHVEHYLQVAFYLRLLENMLTASGEVVGERTGSILKMGLDGELPRWDDEQLRFEVEPYDMAIGQLLEGPDSDVARVAHRDPGEAPYYLQYKCDGCIFNQLCMVESADRQDVALVPYIQPAEVRALRTQGMHSLRDLAELKTLPGPRDYGVPFEPAVGNEARVAALRVVHPVGPNLDRLVQRARAALRRFDDGVSAYGYLLDGEWSQLPSDDANPELVKIFLDAQRDYVEDRVYLAGALVKGPRGERHCVHITPDRPTDADEEALVVGVVREMLEAMAAVAADAESAPVHLYVYDAHDQRVLLEALGRHLEALRAVPAFFDLLAASPATGQPMVSALHAELRDRRNFEDTCQNLYSMAPRFGWKWRDDAVDFTELFRRNVFDNKRRRDDGVWIERASRHSSSIPLEYAYGAWNRLSDDPKNAALILEYRRCTSDSLVRFQIHRLRAVAHIEAALTGKSKILVKDPLPVGGLHEPVPVAALPRALEEFLLIEHHTALQERLRLFGAPIARRAETGRALLLRCEEIAGTGRRQVIRFRIDYAALGLDGMAMLEALRIKDGDWMVLNPLGELRAWKIVKGRVAVVQGIDGDTVTLAWAGFAAHNSSFRYWHDTTLLPEVGAYYTLDEMADDLNADKFLDAARHSEGNALFTLLSAAATGGEPVASTDRRRRFRERLRELEAPLRRTARQEEVIAGFADAPVLLVQGPPGSGKTATLGWAVLARLFERDDRPLRVAVCARTHNATNLVLASIAEKLRVLGASREGRSMGEVTIFKTGGDAGDVPAGVRWLNAYGGGATADEAFDAPVAVIGGTAGGLYTLVKQWRGSVDWNDKLWDLLVIDEASQMGLPEALTAAAWLKLDGALLVVGDHRQMPPILQHDWQRELKRSATTHRPHRSIFETLLEHGFPRAGLDESFRLHRTQAAFLATHIYARDGIPFHSRREALLPSSPLSGDDYLTAALRFDYPLIVIEHSESASQQFNALEAELVAPLIGAAVNELHLDAQRGIGIVVPHRAQKAVLCQAFPALAAAGAIDTVERFQGGERDLIIVSATASDPSYVLQESRFLLNLNRLNVAISRPRHKLIVVASSTIFRLLLDDRELWEHALLWKRLRAYTSERLWQGARGGHQVTVWGHHCGHSLPVAAPQPPPPTATYTRRARSVEAW